MTLLFSSKTDDADLWRDALADELQDLDFRVWTPGGEGGADGGDPADIEYALVWAPKKGALRKFPNLACPRWTVYAQKWKSSSRI